MIIRFLIVLTFIVLFCNQNYTNKNTLNELDKLLNVNYTEFVK